MLPELYASINPIPGASSKIPVFVDADGTTLTESAVILNYLEDKYPQHPQLPKDAAGKAKARLFIELLPQTFPAHLYAFMGADPGPEREKQRELFLTSLDAFEALLKNTKLDDGDFVLGTQFSIADAQVAPFFNTVKVLFGKFRNMDIFTTARERKLEHTLRWAEAIYKRDTVTRSLCVDEDLVAHVGHHPYFKA